MYGLLGRKLGHSLSPQIHSLLGGYSYKLFCREPEELDGFFADSTIEGFNVTIPYKVTAMKYCADVTGTAKKTGCVNTVVRRSDGSLFGDNTDYYGFCRMAEKYGADFENKKVLVLGNGGASGTVRTVAADRGAAEVVTISRRGENNYENIGRHFDADIIVNATPFGMYPDNGGRLIDLQSFKNCGCVLDLIYNPCRTGLIMDAERLGIPCGNGLFMLVAQALRSAERFLDKKLDDSVMETVYKKILCAQKNIVLIGMPGCGKSTVGAGLAELTGRPFIDTDAEIVKKEGRPIPEIFSADGEEYFRIAEFAAVAEAGKKTGVIISTGGGAVMREENREALSQNGTVIYLKRDVASLARDGRPLSADGEAVEKLYRQRKKIYETFASFSIEVDNDIDATVREVMKCISL